MHGVILCSKSLSLLLFPSLTVFLLQCFLVAVTEMELEQFSLRTFRSRVVNTLQSFGSRSRLPQCLSWDLNSHHQACTIGWQGHLLSQPSPWPGAGYRLNCKALNEERTGFHIFGKNTISIDGTWSLLYITPPKSAVQITSQKRGQIQAVVRGTYSKNISITLVRQKGLRFNIRERKEKEVERQFSG